MSGIVTAFETAVEHREARLVSGFVEKGVLFTTPPVEQHTVLYIQ